MSKSWLEPRSRGSSSLRLPWLRLPPILSNSFILWSAGLGSSQDRLPWSNAPCNRHIDCLHTYKARRAYGAVDK